jgi:outer membrane protein OmpA-like peptidoglycan-associated protein
LLIKKSLHILLLFLTVFVSRYNLSAQLYALTGSDFYVYFNSDSYLLEPDQKNIIKQQLLEIGTTNIKEIYIEGHTDSFASKSYNLSLAQHRAQATSNYLLELGVPARFIRMESFGEAQLISDNHRNNRRAKIYIVYETDAKSTLYPPKFIRIKTINSKTKKPIKANLGFNYKDKEMKFSATNASGFSPVFKLLSDDLEITAAADYYLSCYMALPPTDIDKPIDTLDYVLELQPVKITGKFTFNSIFFFTDSDEIRPESTPELYKLLAVLQRNNSAFIEIQGHMNYPIDRPRNKVQSQYNMELSFKRAKAVNDFLITSGIAQERLTFRGMSNTRMKFPLPGSKAEEDQNKRVEVYTLKPL